MFKFIGIAAAFGLIVGTVREAVAFSPELLLSRNLCAQDEANEKQANADGKPAADNKSAADADAFQKLLDRIGKLEAEVDRLKNVAPAAAGATKGGPVLTLIDVAHVGMAYGPTGQSRYVAIRITLANTSDQPVTLTREQVAAEIDGEARKLEQIPAGTSGYSFQYGKQNYSLNTMQPKKSWKVTAGGQNSIWLVYAGLPVSATVPRCKLKLTLGEVTKEIDVNELQRAVLGLESERIGPRNSLALLTITGMLNAFNMQSIIDEMERLVTQKVMRVVLRWSADAPQPDGPVMNGLNQATAALGQPRNGNEQFPAIPSTLREFHLVKYSDNDGAADFSGYRGGNFPQRARGCPRGANPPARWCAPASGAAARPATTRPMTLRRSIVEPSR